MRLYIVFEKEEYIPNGELRILQNTLRHLITRIEVLEEDHYHTKKMVAMLLDNINRRLSRAE
ncbi:hypothetical protein M9C84_02595 [SAR86 cluster bacterium]|nr:hypothetical protein M9C84_02595 [SAR86 cluster bacterium]